MIQKRIIHFNTDAKEDQTQSFMIGRASKKEGNESRFEKEDNLLLLDGTVSKRHAVIDVSTSKGETSVKITDLGSHHGTVWKDKLLLSGATVTLKDGDYIGLVCSKKYQTTQSTVDSIAEWTHAPLNCCKFQFRIQILAHSAIFELVDVKKELSQEAENIMDSDSFEEDVGSIGPQSLDYDPTEEAEFDYDNDYDYDYAEEAEIDPEIEELSAGEEVETFQDDYESYSGPEVEFSEDEVIESYDISAPEPEALDSTSVENETTEELQNTNLEEVEEEESDVDSTFSNRKRSFSEVDEDVEEVETSISCPESKFNAGLSTHKKLRLVLVPEDELKNSSIKSKLYAGLIGAVLGGAFTFGTLASIGKSLSDSI